MSELIKLLKDFLPIEIALLIAIFIYFLLVFKRVADKFISISERRSQLSQTQTKYIQDRLDVVEKTLGISDRAFDLQEKQIKKLQEIVNQQREEIVESDKAKSTAENKYRESEDHLNKIIKDLNLKEQQVADLQAALTKVELNSRVDATNLLAHELLIPIQVVMVDVENLLQEDKLQLDSNERAHLANRIISQLKLMGYQLQNIRFSVDFGEKVIIKEKINAIDLIKECMSLFFDEAHEKAVNLKIETAGSRSSFFIEGDKSKLRLALLNIVGNAVKYSFKGTDVLITVDRKDSFNRITVTNTGVGILPEDLRKIFEFGYRGALSRDVRRTGSGSGLWVAKRVIEMHSGKIEVTSSELSNGKYLTTFEILVGGIE